ncbi:MAG: glycerate kinase [Solobacterium sp.]|nr:glycerate kinase [Solobacterium sp.]
MTILNDASAIMKAALDSAMPDVAVKKALSSMAEPKGKIVLISVGKAAWQMAKAAQDYLGDKISDGVCITKYDHVMGEIPHVRCYEAGHPVVDENSINATKQAEELVNGLTADDTVVFLVSGGGSALFEDPCIPLEELQGITKKLLACGADITEINTIRKRLSNVKGGKFAEQCEPASVFSIILSDIIGDPLDMIASGPAYPDSSTSEDVLAIVRKYQLSLSDTVMDLFTKETPKELKNVETHITGSVRQLCKAAVEESQKLGYEPVFLTASLDCEARDAGSMLAAIARDHYDDNKSLAYVCGGETVVHLTGKGLGGRNQEIALSAAAGISGLKDVAVFSLGSDGTDGPTDAAGGIVTGETSGMLKDMGILISDVLNDNDAYHALQKVNGLITTGPTGTNVNDVTVLLIKK